MNYRHIYHAGNFADVMKHLGVVLILDRLRGKEAPFFALDAHGGCGFYDLSSEQAQKTGEWQAGIGRFADDDAMPADFRLYYDLVKRDLAVKAYPGSPTLIARLLRAQDRLVASELHPEDVETLRRNLAMHKGVRVQHQDAYECIRSQMPPKEKRGLVLIDPPFEKTDEFETLCRQMEEWKKRFANGIYVIWYPVKAHLPVGGLKEAARALGLPRTWVCETLLHPRGQEGVLNGCGVIVFNAPYMMPERMAALLPYLCEKMELFDAPHSWLVPDSASA